MTRTCTVRTYSERASIDKAWLANEALQNITKRYAIGASEVFRHKTDRMFHFSTVTRFIFHPSFTLRSVILSYIEKLFDNGFAVEPWAPVQPGEYSSLRRLHSRRR
jgi:hypothetical protein